MTFSKFASIIPWEVLQKATFQRPLNFLNIELKELKASFWLNAIDNIIMSPLPWYLLTPFSIRGFYGQELFNPFTLTQLHNDEIVLRIFSLLSLEHLVFLGEAILINYSKNFSFDFCLSVTMWRLVGRGEKRNGF